MAKLEGIPIDLTQDCHVPFRAAINWLISIHYRALNTSNVILWARMNDDDDTAADGKKVKQVYLLLPLPTHTHTSIVIRLNPT